MVAARNIAIILLLAAAVAFVPGGGTTAAVIRAVLGTLILVSFVMLAGRFYREHRFDLDTLGDRWRALLYGAIAVAIVDMAARPRLVDLGGGGTLLWAALLAASAYSVYLVWRHHRQYG